MDKLGEGSYGEVYRAKNLNTNEYTAAKIIHIRTSEIPNDFEIELDILKKISKQQENLPDFIGIYGDFNTFNSPRIWFIMELCSLGPITRLLKQIEKRNKLISSEKEKLIAYSLKCTLKGLKYLHQSGIMHRGKFNLE